MGRKGQNHRRQSYRQEGYKRASCKGESRASHKRASHNWLALSLIEIMGDSIIEILNLRVSPPNIRSLRFEVAWEWKWPENGSGLRLEAWEPDPFECRQTETQPEIVSEIVSVWNFRREVDGLRMNFGKAVHRSLWTSGNAIWIRISNLVSWKYWKFWFWKDRKRGTSEVGAQHEVENSNWQSCKAYIVSLSRRSER